MNKITITLVLLMTVLALTAQNTSTRPCPTSVTDYDGNKYNVIQLGGRCWMKENLRTTHYADGANAYFYRVSYNKDNDAIYGLLYDWNTAKGIERGIQGICPDGWYLPSDWEWQQLEIEAGLEEKMANSMTNIIRGDFAAKLCSKEGWLRDTDHRYNMAPGCDQYNRNSTGFSVLPAGEGDGFSFSRQAFFWTATEYDKNNALCRKIEYYFPMVYRKGVKKERHFSVRCVRRYEEEQVITNNREGYLESENIAQSERNVSGEDSISENITVPEEKVYESANTSDTLVVYENGYILHKLWTSNINKNVVGVLMSQPGGKIYRGLLYLRDVKEPTDILNQKTINCQHLLGAYEIGNYLYDVTFADSSEWGSIAKTWEDPNWHKISNEEKYDNRLYWIQRYIRYYKTSITFFKDGTGYQTFSVEPEILAEQRYSSYSNGRTGLDRRSGGSVSGGYKFTVNGTAKNTFKWEYVNGYLSLVFDETPNVSTTASMTDKFENVYPANRQRHIAQAKQDMGTNPQVKEWKKNVADALKILAQQAGMRVYITSFISNHTLRLWPVYLGNDELVADDNWIDFYSKDNENFFIPSIEEMTALSDKNTLTLYETEKQKAARIAEERRLAEEKRREKERKAEERRIAEEKKRKNQEYQSVVAQTCISIFEKLQKCVSDKTGYFDFTKMNDTIYNHFDFSSLLSGEEMMPANKETVLQYKLYRWLPPYNFKLDTAVVIPSGDVRVWGTFNRNSSPKNVFDTYSSLQLVFANDTTILIDSISCEALAWQDNSEKKYDMREQMIERDRLLLGKYKKIAPFITKSYLSYQKEKQISVKKHYQQSDQNIKTFTTYQYAYLLLAYMREQTIKKQQFITFYAGKTHSDVAKALNLFMKQKEGELLPENNLKDLLETLREMSDTEDSCLTYLMNRRVVEENHLKISSKKKTCKYIVEAYEKHFKSVDKSWTPSEKNDKLAGERELQRKVLSLVNSANASELNTKAKQLKKERIEIIIEKLK